MTKPKPARGESGAHVWCVERNFWGDSWCLVFGGTSPVRRGAVDIAREQRELFPEYRVRIVKYIRQSSKPAKTRGKV